MRLFESILSAVEDETIEKNFLFLRENGLYQKILDGVKKYKNDKRVKNIQDKLGENVEYSKLWYYLLRDINR